MTALSKPLIGVTVDYDMPQDRSPFYHVRQNYCIAVEQAGGIPVLLPFGDVGDFVNFCQGILVTGGGFDVSPELYGTTAIHPSVRIKKERTDFEGALIRKTLEQGKPLLGICGGAQILNVVLGGTLFQHIPDEIPEALPHIATSPGENFVNHSIQLMKQTQLEQHSLILGEVVVNSSHHQSIKTLGDGVVVSALAADGVVEGIEVPRYAFCWGIQWHPEYHVSPLDFLIFQKFISASLGFA